MAKAKRLPSGNWRVQASATINGKKVVKSFTATTANKAEMEALKWQEYYKVVDSDPSSLTLNQAVDSYIELKSNILSPSTIRSYRSIQKTYFDDIGKIKLCKLTQNIVQKKINDLSVVKSPKTIKNVYGLISAVMGQYAPEYSIGRIALPQPKKTKVKALSKAQISLLLQNIDGDVIEIPILLALWLGLRRSEILALHWEDIDFKNKTITIDKALVPDEYNNMVIKPPKTTDSERTLKLPDYILEKLKPLRQESGKIFDISEDLLSKRFPRICRNIGIGEGYKFHDLRRSMATVGLSLNIADKIMMARGGWHNTKTMKEIYQLVLNDDIENADDQINKYFEKILKENQNNSHENSHKSKKYKLIRHI